MMLVHVIVLNPFPVYPVTCPFSSSSSWQVSPQRQEGKGVSTGMKCETHSCKKERKKEKTRSQGSQPWLVRRKKDEGRARPSSLPSRRC